MRSLQLSSRRIATLALGLALCGWVAAALIRRQVPTSLVWAAGLLTLAGASAAAVWSWNERQRLQEGVQRLIGAAERLGRGEFSQPIEADLSGHLGRLLRAFERTRVALNDTTYSRDYLHSVLNSMSDSVFVAAPDGAIRIVNDAAQRPVSYTHLTLPTKRIV